LVACGTGEKKPKRTGIRLSVLKEKLRLGSPRKKEKLNTMVSKYGKKDDFVGGKKEKRKKKQIDANDSAGRIETAGLDRKGYPSVASLFFGKYFQL